LNTSRISQTKNAGFCRLVANAAELRESVGAQLWNEKEGVFMASTGLEAANIDLWVRY
jgi:hypothetical protein